jgi:TPR repeat protein
MWWSAASKVLASHYLSKAAPIVAAVALHSSGNSDHHHGFGNSVGGYGTTMCEQADDSSKAARAKLLRKRTTLQHAAPCKANHHRQPRRINTQQALSKIRRIEQEMLQRWQNDEDGWRELPARAWPAYQPNAEQLKGIRAEIRTNGCNTSTATSSSKTNNNNNYDLCTELLFNSATAMVFYNVDAEAGFRQFEELAKQGHVESMVACGVILLEGMGVPTQEEKGIEWLRKAVALGSAQACYELGTALYTGIDGLMDEDPEGAFELFSRAAETDHTAALYMMADCLVEGEGTKKDIARAVPLLYKAAEQGHRYSRQRIRELLARKEYQIPL